MHLSRSLSTFFLAAIACGQLVARETDVHSYARPEHVRVRHVDLDLEVNFERQRLQGQATLTIERTSKDETRPLLLDSRKLVIDRVETSANGKDFEPGRFEVGKEDACLGSPVTVTLPPTVKAVRIYYATSNQASGLQWLSREMTSGKKYP